MKLARVDLRTSSPFPRGVFIMLFVIVGVLIIAANLAEIGPFATWTWAISGDLWRFCVPFALAAAWWAWADASGLNKRREMAKMELRKQNRRNESLASLGLGTPSGRKGGRK
jgi:small Trp-rich protein